MQRKQKIVLRKKEKVEFKEKYLKFKADRNETKERVKKNERSVKNKQMKDV